MSAIGLVLNEIYLYVFVSLLGIAPAISKVVATFLVTIFNFITRKLFLEDRRSERPQPAIQDADDDILAALGEGGKDVEAILREEIDIVTGKKKFKIF